MDFRKQVVIAAAPTRAARPERASQSLQFIAPDEKPTVQVKVLHKDTCEGELSNKEL